MEKYAVDSADPIEMEAAEMVKTGEAESLSEARSLTQEKGEEDGSTTP